LGRFYEIYLSILIHLIAPFLTVFNRIRIDSMTYENKQPKNTLLRLEQVKARTGLSRSTIYAYMNEGRFPAPVAISERCVAWVEGEIDSWIAERIASRRRG
jgi:prophage regulatory protein